MARVKNRATTLGQLRSNGYQVLSIREELRQNLIAKMQKNEDLFPGIVGYEDSVIPQLENAILAGQDIILLGERGQAKSRIIRSMVQLLNEQVPIIAGSEVNDNPFAPISKYGKDMVEQQGDATKIEWIGRDHRYGEKLATPDISIADLIGDVDPIRVAEGLYLSDELAIHYGLIPRTNRGIFCINELPDLAERIQVGLFNLMEERDVQIKGYRVQMPLDVLVVASANPEDYTNRGRIITPLKDRYGAQVRTHYPRKPEQEIAIMEAERSHFPELDERVYMPGYIREILAEFTNLARRHPEINQHSGVSVRVSIANYETVLANALRRAIRLGEKRTAPRVSDLPAMVASTLGKIEMDSVEEGREVRLFEDLVKRSVLNVFDRHFSSRDFDLLVQKFDEGFSMEIGADVHSRDYVKNLKQLDGFSAAIGQLHLGEEDAAIASGMEFILEGLHLNRRLNRDRVESGGFRYRS
jgi:magnesium chelatase subunit I